ncbi:unnamed protein product [Camellia sinensis]
MSSTQVAHSLAFSVMRLSRLSFHVETPLCFDPCDLIGGKDLFDDPVAASHFPRLLLKHSPKSSDSDLSYRSRFLLHDPSEALGFLVLPQAFGAIYLGLESRKGEGMSDNQDVLQEFGSSYLLATGPLLCWRNAIYERRVIPFFLTL